MRCTTCRYELASGDRFCANCGAPVPQAPGVEVRQTIGTVTKGGTVVGVIQGSTAPMSIGGQHYEGDTVLGDKATGDHISVGNITDSSGVAIGRGATSTVHTTGGTAITFNHGHALLVGVGSYEHAPQLNVPITAADAEAVAAVLRDPAFCGYPPEQVTLLHDATASRQGILAALDALAERAGPEATVFLFFCGHGNYGDDNEYYLTTHETRLANRRVVSGTGLRQAELISRLRAIKARRVLIIVNACHAGELVPLGGEAAPLIGAPLPAQTAAALLATGEGRIIITACREHQVAHIGRGTLTLFTQALVDGLQGRGTSGRHGFISAFDLYTHLYFTITETVREQYGAIQEPELTVLKGVGPFAVALCPGAPALGGVEAAEAPITGMAVREVDLAYSQAMLERLAPPARP